MDLCTVLPFSHLDDESFQLTLYELEDGLIRQSPDRLAALSFNPLQLNSKHHLTLTNNIDPDDIFHQLNS